MRKIIFISSLIALFGFTDADVEIVKNGVFDFNKTITVGDALSNWKSCDKVFWDNFRTENGVRVVEFSCIHKAGDYFKNIEKIVSRREDVGSNLDIAYTIHRFFFTLNVDQSFQLDNVQAITVWNDETIYQQDSDPFEMLKMVYGNEVILDGDSINEMKATILYGHYKTAKMFSDPNSMMHLLK